MPSNSDVNFKQEVEESMRIFSNVDKGKQFARAVLEFAYGYSREDAINANACDGSNDKGLDAFWSDEDYFYMFQFKYHDDPFGQTISAGTTGAVNQLVDCWPIVTDSALASQEYQAGRIREPLLNAAREFEDVVKNKGKKVKDDRRRVGRWHCWECLECMHCLAQWIGSRSSSG